MKMVAMVAELSLCMVMLLCCEHGAYGARMLIRHIQKPCLDVPEGISGRDCYIPPIKPHPSSQIDHQNRRLAFSADIHPDAHDDMTNIAHTAGGASPIDAALGKQSAHAQRWLESLPVCKDVPLCDRPPPACDLKLQEPGINCRLDSPPSN